MGDTKKTLADYPNLTDEKIKALTPEERREAGRLGGIASGKARKKKKTMRAIYESLAGQKVNGETVQKLQGTLKKVKKDLTVEESIVLAQVLVQAQMPMRWLLLMLCKMAVSMQLSAMTAISR